MVSSDKASAYFAIQFLKRHNLDTTEIIQSGKDLRDYIEHYVENGVMRDLELQGKHDTSLLYCLFTLALHYSSVDWDGAFARLRIAEEEENCAK